MKAQPPMRIGDSNGSAAQAPGGLPARPDSLVALASATTLVATRGPRADSGTPRTRHRRPPWLEVVTSLRVVVAVGVVSVLLLSISGVVGSKFLGPRAHGAEEDATAALVGGPAIPEADLEVLRQQAERARARLLAGRQELRTVLERIENEARRRGWRVELSLSPPVNRPHGLDQVTAYPVALHLTPSGDDAPPGFRSLIDWLDGIPRSPRHAAVTGLSLRANGKGRTALRVDLQVFGVMENDQAAPQ